MIGHRFWDTSPADHGRLLRGQSRLWLVLAALSGQSDGVCGVLQARKRVRGFSTNRDGPFFTSFRGEHEMSSSEIRNPESKSFISNLSVYSSSADSSSSQSSSSSSLSSLSDGTLKRLPSVGEGSLDLSILVYSSKICAVFS